MNNQNRLRLISILLATTTISGLTTLAWSVATAESSPTAIWGQRGERSDDHDRRHDHYASNEERSEQHRSRDGDEYRSQGYQREDEQSRREYDDDDDDRDGRDFGPFPTLYAQECGDGCHIAYPAELMAPEARTGLMDGLSDHFGKQVSLSAEKSGQLRDWLQSRPWRNHHHDGQPAGLRITESRYFLRKHDEINPRWVSDNLQVRRWSRCDACHEEAAIGRYDEHRVSIPGHGRWED